MLFYAIILLLKASDLGISATLLISFTRLKSQNLLLFMFTEAQKERKLTYQKSEVARACGLSLATLRKEIAPLIAKGCILWHATPSAQGRRGGRKFITAKDANIIFRYLEEGIIP